MVAITIGITAIIIVLAIIHLISVILAVAHSIVVAT